MAKKILFVIAPENFRDEELFEPLQVMEIKGAKTTIASTKTGTARGKMGGTVEIGLNVKDCHSRDYDAIAFVGGNGVEQFKLYENSDVLRLAREFSNAGKPTCAICIAPRILAAAGVIKGKKATCFPDPESIAMVKQSGAHYSTEHMVVDGNVITADGPKAAQDFGLKIAEALKL